MARKRFLSSILLIGMLFAMSTVAFATNDAPDMPAEPAAYSVTTNEYDIYTHSRRLSNKELSNQGMSETHINLIKSDAIAAPHLLDSMIYWITSGVLYYAKRDTKQTIHTGV